jgi:pyruvate dehydrogenase E2 component (dihydrolipoamide acetyltransferase)
MAHFEFKLPDIGEGVTEGEIVAWLIKTGDAVIEDQPMIEVMTDKATVTITSPKAGRVLRTQGQVGEVVKVHEVLVVFDLGEAGVSQAPAAAAVDLGPAATAVGDIKENLPGMAGYRPMTMPIAAGVPAGQGSPGYFNEKPLATPATRKLARDLGLDLKQVAPTGPQGRVTQNDVEMFSKGSARRPLTDLLPPATQANGVETSKIAHAPGFGTGTTREPVRIAPRTGAAVADEERVPFAGMRRKIAAKMAQSKQTAAHFTFVEECDVTALVALRNRLKGPAEKQGVKLTFLAIIAKAVVAALKKHPVLNSALDESTQELVYRKYINLGIAASTPTGLMVPVVKSADRMSILELAREVDRLALDAKAGKSKLEDLSGSTFTITSLGAQGGLFATPIINFPEVGILGVHQMKEKPVVKNGEIVIGTVMLLSLSFDHRIVDGHIGAAFAYEIIGFLENPDRLMLEMS